MLQKTKLSTAILVAVFFAGFGFLLFEVNIFRAVSNLLGSTITASTIVISVFMGGYGSGAFIFGKKAVAVHNLAYFFTVILALFAIGGAFSYFILNNLFSNIYEILFRRGLNTESANTIVYCITVIVLFVPPFLVGGILPVATQLLIRNKQDISVKVGHVYALDTFGSAIGGILTGFFMNRYLGQTQTILGITAILLLLTLFVKHKISEPETTNINHEPSPKSKIKESAITVPDKKICTTALASALLLGFAMNAMQVLLIRAFKIYLINAVYSFTLITSLVILGLFIGSWIFKTLSQKQILTIKTLLTSVIFFGILLPCVLWLTLNLPEKIMFPLNQIFNNQLFRVIGIPIAAAVTAVLPLSIISGFVFPLACSLYTTEISQASKQIGKVVMLNTIGSVLGPLVATFLLVRFLGVSYTIIWIAVIIFLCGTVLIYMLKDKFKSKILLYAGSFGLCFMLVIAFSGKQFPILPPSFFVENKKIVAINETVEGSYVVGEKYVGNNRVLSTYVNNSLVIGTSYDAIKAVKMIGHLPFTLGLKCKNALVVGFGIGATTAAIGSHTDVENIDCIELVSALAEAAHFYEPVNNNIHLDKRLNFIEDDGRHFIKTTQKKYDLISSDPTHPILGSGNLYTREYFELCRSHLTPNGMVSQYLPIHKIRLYDLMGLIKTFHSVFPNSSVWFGHYHAVLIGSVLPQNIDFSQWMDNMYTTQQDSLFYSNPYNIAASLIFDSKAIDSITTTYQINSDNIAYTDYFSFDCLDDSNVWKNLQYLNENRTNLARFFANIEDTVLMSRFLKGNKYLTTGLYYMLQGNNTELRKYLERAAMVNPENVEYQLLLELGYSEDNYEL